MENINVEKLQELGIFEIRNIARNVGVYLPTTLKKDELINKIMRIINGIDKPYIKKTKQGRPPKTLDGINNLMDVIVPKQIFDETQKNSNESYFNDLNESININVIGTNESYFKSLIYVYNNDYALAFVKDYKEDKENTVFINKKQVEFYSLKSGDEIAGKSLFLDSDKPLILKEIYAVNGVNFSQNYKRAESFDSLPAIISKDKLKMDIYKDDDEIFTQIDLICPLAKGQRVILQSTRDNFLNYQILNRLSTAGNNLKGLAVLIDETPENYYEMLNVKDRIDVISNNFVKNNNFKLELDVKIEKLKRQVEQGSDVVLFINDISKLYNYILNGYVLKKSSFESASIFAEDYIKKCILSGKFTGEGSLTVVVGNNYENYKQNFEIKFGSMFNNFVIYSKKGFDYMLDIDNSYAYNLDKILTKTEQKKYNELKHSK